MKNLICTTLLIEKSPQALPLGAACIASAVKNSPQTKNQYHTELFDFCRESKEILKLKTDEDTASYMAEKLLEKNPDFVIFSVYVWNHLVLEKTALKLKKIKSSIITIAGGPEVTADPFVFSGFDYTIAGSGEGAAVKLLECIHNNPGKFSDGEIEDYKIPGVYACKGEKLCGIEKKIVSGQSGSPLRALPCLPENLSSPYLDGTLDPSKYGGALWELARGCPFKCSYCYESKGEKKVSYFPEERLSKELDLFARKKVPQVFVLDPTYNASKERAVKMLKLIEKKTPDTFYYFEARAEFIDRELARAFKNVRCALQIGLQSADPEVLKNVHRTLDKKKFCKNIAYLNEEGITFGFDLIYGLPGDTFKGFKNSIDFALSLYPNNLELFCLSVLPGTDLHDSAEGFGLKWEEKPPYHVIKTPQFSESDLKKAASLSRAVNLFYTQGRAVSWFNSAVYHLRIKPSVFLGEFEKYLSEKNIRADDCPDPRKIRIWQKDFVRIQFEKKGLKKLIPVILDLIEFYGALSDADGEGISSKIRLNYWPDDLLSEYALDLAFFAANARRHVSTVNVRPSVNGAVWE
jgi:radical SAM superfamily enzyme YgiQ (UPF0313 family)